MPPAPRLSYRQETQGLVTAEFTIIALALLALSFFVVELTALYFSLLSAQKAAQMGARAAVVSAPAAAGVPLSNDLSATGIYGRPCGDSPSPCAGFATRTCAGGSGCDSAAFSRILARMRQFLGGLQAAHVRITYAYAALGYAGGPAIPRVTLSISGVPYRTGILGRLIGAAHGAFVTLPAVSVTLTGEDLNPGGAQP